jgi:hypothetical protein
MIIYGHTQVWTNHKIAARTATHVTVVFFADISGPEKFYPEEASAGGNSARQVALPHCSLDLEFLQVPSSHDLL